MDRLRLTLAKRRTSSIKTAPLFPNSVYHPLNTADREVRILLVNISEKDSDGRLICNLCVVSRSRTFCLPKYEAISWCWGDSEAKEDILLNGKVVAVPANAVKALNELCFVNGHDRIWIDCICINQTDVKEQGHQVSMMQEIYSKAERVLVWLGEDEGLTEAALLSMDTIHQQCVDFAIRTTTSTKLWERLSAAEQRKLLDKLFWNPRGDETSFNIGFPDCNWPAVEAFYASPWFTRLWVVQEVILGNRILCYRGKYTRSWDFVGAVAQWMIRCGYLKTHAHAETPRGIQNASDIWSNQHQYRSADLSSLLLMSVSLEASDPKDKIYSIYGLLQQLKTPTRIMELLAPDYTKTVEEIFTSATLACLEQNSHSRNALYPLELAHSLVPMVEEDRMMDKTPSWVPRYDWKSDPRRRTRMRNPCASGDLELSLLINPADPFVIRVKGLHIGTIRDTSESVDFDARCDPKEVAPLLRRLKQLVFSVDVEEREFALTLTSGTSEISAKPHEDPQFMEQYHTFEGECYDDLRVEFSDEAFSFCLAIWLASGERRLFQTKSKIGMGPSNMFPGDVIVILLGADLPFILRPSAEDDSYQVIGTAYVCNVMAGEFIQKFGSRLEEKARWFDIR